MVDGRLVKTVKSLYLSNGLIERHHPTLSVLLIKLQILSNKAGLSFSFVAKVTTLKQQISKFDPQILSTESSF